MGAGSTSVQEQLQEIPESDARVTEALIQEARQEAFRWAANQIRDEFTKKTWAMFWATCVDGLPIAEVAKSHGRSAGAVYVARSRVMQRIKERVLEFTDTWSAIK